ncbi:CLUMA_CG008487, isoform A [Clunio marinus]|uniref:CLUMA_CG008487, isoform A n=1 Tax=Clunio marinus TaxID=568069 RepID=A0A1J1I996_9DIPT|nr:CLUMA_CG008487, isoform A [Clunio marinus]
MAVDNSQLVYIKKCTTGSDAWKILKLNQRSKTEAERRQQPTPVVHEFFDAENNTDNSSGGEDNSSGGEDFEEENTDNDPEIEPRRSTRRNFVVFNRNKAQSTEHSTGYGPRTPKRNEKTSQIQCFLIDQSQLTDQENTGNTSVISIIQTATMNNRRSVKKRLETSEPPRKIEKLNNENYSSWFCQMKLILMREEVWYLMEDLKNEDTSNAPAEAAEQMVKKSNDETKALHAIAMAVDNSQLVYIKKCTTGSDAWKILKLNQRSKTEAERRQQPTPVVRSEIQSQRTV